MKNFNSCKSWDKWHHYMATGRWPKRVKILKWLSVPRIPLPKKQKEIIINLINHKGWPIGVDAKNLT